jgi:hypothetical protein
MLQMIHGKQEDISETPSNAKKNSIRLNSRQTVWNTLAELTNHPNKKLKR